MTTHPDDTVGPQDVRVNQYSEAPTTMLMGGLTKREYFAAAALQGLCASKNTDEDPLGEIALFAVLLADATIKKLNEKAK